MIPYEIAGFDVNYIYIKNHLNPIVIYVRHMSAATVSTFYVNFLLRLSNLNFTASVTWFVILFHLLFSSALHDPMKTVCMGWVSAQAFAGKRAEMDDHSYNIKLFENDLSLTDPTWRRCYFYKLLNSKSAIDCRKIMIHSLLSN